MDKPLPFGVTAKDLILGIIGQIGVHGGTGHVIEYTGEGVRGLSMEGRMTVCNMSIEGGSPRWHGGPGRHYLRVREGSSLRPQGRSCWNGPSSNGGVFRPMPELPTTRWWRSTPPTCNHSSHGAPTPAWWPLSRPAFQTRHPWRIPGAREAAERALTYMGLEPDMPIQEIEIDRVFLGSCTNSRLEDLRAAAEVVKAAGRPAGGRRGGKGWTSGEPQGIRNFDGGPPRVRPVFREAEAEADLGWTAFSRTPNWVDHLRRGPAGRLPKIIFTGRCSFCNCGRCSMCEIGDEPRHFGPRPALRLR